MNEQFKEQITYKAREFATAYTNRLFSDEPAFSFGNEGWANFVDALVALSHPKSIEADSGVIAAPVAGVNLLKDVEEYIMKQPAVWDGMSLLKAVRAAIKAGEQAAPVVPAPVAIPAYIHVTEAMHRAAVNVLHRAHGLDGLPQRMMDAMLAAAPPQAAPVAQLSEPPKGWKLMSIIPTDAMRDAGNEIIGNRSKLFKAYGAMLAAAPTTPKD